MTNDIKYGDNPEISKYREILGTDPSSKAFAPLADAYRKAGMLDEAISTAKEGLILYPNYLSAIAVLGRCYYEKGMFKEAEEELAKVVKMAPDNIAASNLLGVIRQKIQEEAKVEVKEVEEIAEETAAAEFAETEEFTGFGEVEEESEGFQVEEISGESQGPEIVAVKEEEKEVRPRKEITTETIAELYIKQGYFDRAIDIYQTLYDADPGNDEIKSKLEELKRRAEVKSGVKEAGLTTPTSQEPVGVAERHDLPLQGQETVKDESLRKLEAWLNSIQSERRKG